ncbi:MAG: hypothetical protein IAE91_02285 [Ignavibacteriaceae bacterium]|nr:hypothetical protein [Ignavibacteriaceae bacterium]
MKKTNLLAAVILFIVIIFQPSELYPQNDKDSTQKSIFDNVYDAISLGVVVRFGSELQSERISGNNGFEFRAVRLRVGGEISEDAGYFIQTSFIGSPILLDARIYFQLSPGQFLDAGVFKAPFSREVLISTSDIDFVDRSVVTRLAPNRQLGVQFRGNLPGTAINFNAGVFNGNRFSNEGNDNNKMMYVSRVSYTPKLPGNKNSFEIALNFAYSEDKSVDIPGISNSFEGKRILFGSDTRLVFNNFLFTAEMIFGNFEPVGNSNFKPKSYQVTAGYKFNEKIEVLIRKQEFNSDTFSPWINQNILGVNYIINDYSQIQFNYVVPENSQFDEHLLLLNAQIAFKGKDLFIVD